MAEREQPRPESIPRDPEGPDPPDIPDPMPAELRRQPDDDQTAGPEEDPMEGEAPSG